VFYGDHSARIKDLARLAGFEVMVAGQARTRVQRVMPSWGIQRTETMERGIENALDR